MAQRKERTLRELYNVTDVITEPKITPVLKGSCRMQGPIDETDYDIQANMVSSGGEKGFGRCSTSQKVDVREESGTCNVCSAPCSSCLHINRALMGSKTDESYRGNAFSRCSLNDVKSSAGDNDQHTASEASNLFCVNSSHDYFSENAESKSSVRNFDVSGASQDVETLPKLSAGVAVVGDQRPIDPEIISDQRTLANKFEDPKDLEDNDDNSSCVSGVNIANKLASSVSANSLLPEVNTKTPHFQTKICSLDNKFVGEGSHNSSRMLTRFNEDCTQKLPSSALLIELSSPKLDSIGIPSLADMDDASSLKVQSICRHPPIAKSLYRNPNLKDLKEDSYSRLQEELPQCPKECLSPLLLIKAEVSEVVCRQKSASDSDRHDDIQNSTFSHVEGNSEVAERISPNLEAETGIASGDPPAESLNLSEQIDEVEKFKQSPVSPDTLETSFLSQPMDESDESDMVEHDVKVCDICGDAGREDLLAICSRCSDGAEHTYCMSYMLDKVPEGEWMCEECKFDKEIKNPKQDKFAVDGNDKNPKQDKFAGDGNEKNISSGQATTTNTDIFVKLDIKDSDGEETRANNDISIAKASGKRHADSKEVGSAPKRQALEPMTGSPRASNLKSRFPSLSRDCSSKNLDKGKMKPGHQSSSGTYSISDMQETAGARLQTARGSLVKSDSFNSSNGKVKVKLVDEVVLQKQKSAREHVSHDTKEGVVRLIGRSMSFRSTNSGRLNTSESKVKMISPNISHVQDPKVLKEAKDQTLFERKNSFRSESLWLNSTAVSSPISTARVDQKPVCRGETYSLSSVGNNRESKAVQSDSKSTALPKATNRVARRGSEMPLPLGEIKRQSRVVGASFNKGTSSFAEQKPNQISPKDNHLPNTCETPFCNVNESLPEVPRLRESTNPVEIMKDNSVNDSRQNITASGRGIPCHKCKEIGHAAQFCTLDPNRSLVIDASAVRSSKEVINGGNRLKAAIEAAMLKKPGIYRKNRALDRPDELSTSSANLNCGVSSQDQLSNSIKTKNIFIADDVHEGHEIPRTSIVDSCNQTTVKNLKQFPLLPTETLNSITADTSHVKPFMRDLPCHASATVSVLSKMSAIPEYEYVWQGGFEIHKSGIYPQFCDGIQAHLSTCASSKVLEVVNKFPHKVLLNEVPRLSTWPIQFQERGVKYNNVALYFFARDLESYEKSYKGLLENMMKSDVALKGNFDGVELLIFPSNQLPGSSQRWNMLFFLWGVFRVKRVDRSQRVSGSPNNFCTTRDIPTVIMSSPEKICSGGPVDKDVSVADQSFNVHVSCQAPALGELPSLSAEVNGDHDIKVSSLDLHNQCVEANMGRQDCRLYSTSLSRIQMRSVLLCPKERLASLLLEKSVDLDSEVDAELQPSIQATAETLEGCSESEKMPLPWDSPLGRQQDSSLSLKRFPIGRQEGGAVGSVGVEGKRPSLLHSCNDQLKIEWNLEEEEGSLSALDRETMKRDKAIKGMDSWQFNGRKHSLVDSPERFLPPSGGTSQPTSWGEVNGVSAAGSASKKQKTDFGGVSYVRGSSIGISSSRDSFALGIPNAGTCSPMIKEEKWDEACEKRVMPGSSMGNAERYFFPVDPPPHVKDFGLGDNEMSWEVFSPKDVRLHELTPNLELALGAEKKPPSKPGMLPFLVSKVDKKNDQDHHPPENLSTKGVEEDHVSSSLSLSLSFPFPDKEQTTKPVSETEQLLSERRHIKTSLLLFGGFSDK